MILRDVIERAVQEALSSRATEPYERFRTTRACRRAVREALQTAAGIGDAHNKDHAGDYRNCGSVIAEGIRALAAELEEKP